MPHPNNLFLFYLFLITKPVKKKPLSLPKSKPTNKETEIPLLSSFFNLRRSIQNRHLSSFLSRNPVSNGIGTKLMKKLRKNLKMQRKRKKDGT
ncbi:hypothetical protein HID58_082677 [Brassica napus]|uniref:BnaCnng46530D protein n=2 Tax=Brassica napus TaxID=3708 RepID=A0A078JFT1_BRANA|nr:hypothetical protein HID58_082677 [Brassica napus]CAF2113355.1 unnamed protein product [Brassica napus]CDY65305.1 BnaCnng46530D [Brassica napus]